MNRLMSDRRHALVVRSASNGLGGYALSCVEFIGSVSSLYRIWFMVKVKYQINCCSKQEKCACLVQRSENNRQPVNQCHHAKYKLDGYTVNKQSNSQMLKPV